MMARRPAYDLLQGNFQEGWEQFLNDVLRKKRTLDTPNLAGCACARARAGHQRREDTDTRLCVR
jgi:hypothetical protein